jgi:hypothetical protein
VSALQTLQNLFTLAFVITSMLSMGLSLTVPRILQPLRNLRLVTLSLAVNFVVVPAVAFARCRIIPLDQDVQIGLLLIGTAAGAPFLPKLAQIAKTDIAFAVGLDDDSDVSNNRLPARHGCDPGSSRRHPAPCEYSGPPTGPRSTTMDRGPAVRRSPVPTLPRRAVPAGSKLSISAVQACPGRVGGTTNSRCSHQALTSTRKSVIDEFVAIRGVVGLIGAVEVDRHAAAVRVGPLGSGHDGPGRGVPPQLFPVGPG